ncbi:indole-3-glycerol phosphate synthase TrpC [Muriicola sp.]|uniref:indole-3-glycerol phosphate synthase TrpC n=1 Tax=Muriicola sp. TaxID=2020856 RepID=UPI003C74266A
MDILDKIVLQKKKEVALKKSLLPTSQLEASVLFNRETISLSNALKISNAGIIAEFKRRSPSKSVINSSSPVQEVAQGYAAAGVCGMSVLTDGHFFGGSLEDLLLARATVNMPLLRKEFIIDEFQLIEAKAYGADVVLLIASVLSREEIKKFSELANQLHLEVLLEVHNEQELEHALMPGLSMIGVNNRNLKNFEVSLDTSRHLASMIPDEFVKISESGLSNSEAVLSLRKEGYEGFLIGETFMATADPGLSAAAFIKKLGA